MPAKCPTSRRDVTGVTSAWALTGKESNHRSVLGRCPNRNVIPSATAKWWGIGNLSDQPSGASAKEQEHGKRFGSNRSGALQGLRLLRGVLSHPRPCALFRLQRQGLSPALHGQPRKMQRLRSLRYVLPGFRDLRIQEHRRKEARTPDRGTGPERRGGPGCTLIPPAFSPAHTSLTAITPAAKVLWRQVPVS